MSQMFLDAVSGFNAGAQQAGAVIQQGQMAQVDAAWKNRKLAMEDEKLAEDLTSSRESRRRAELALTDELLSSSERRTASKAARELALDQFNESKKTAYEKNMAAFKKANPTASDEEVEFVSDVLFTNSLGLSTAGRDLTGGSSGEKSTSRKGLTEKDAFTMGVDLKESSAKLAKLYADKAELQTQVQSGTADAGQIKAIDTAIAEATKIHETLKTIWKDIPLTGNADAMVGFDAKRLKAQEAMDINERQVQTWRDMYKNKKNAKEMMNQAFDELAGGTPPAPTTTGVQSQTNFGGGTDFDGVNKMPELGPAKPTSAQAEASRRAELEKARAEGVAPPPMSIDYEPIQQPMRKSTSLAEQVKSAQRESVGDARLSTNEIVGLVLQAKGIRQSGRGESPEVARIRAAVKKQFGEFGASKAGVESFIRQLK